MTPVPRRARRAGDVVRAIVAVLVVLHGLVHLMGVRPPAADGRGPALPEPIPASVTLWAVAAVLVVAAGVGLAGARRWPRWWRLGAIAVVVSQAAVLTAWDAAWAGTIANAVLALAVVHGWCAEGPRGRRDAFRRRLAELTGPAAGTASDAPLVTEADLAHLPDLVATYVRRSGAVGRPRSRAFRVVLSGRIRAYRTSPWMSFVGEQVSTVAAGTGTGASTGTGPQVTRWFRMDATMLGLPVDVLHVYEDGAARMSAAVCSVVRVAQADGPLMGRAETVTVLNDLCVLAPWTLVDAPIAWTPVDDRRVRARWTCGGQTAEAVLVFDDAGDLVDFLSGDRARIDGARVDELEWSTPVGEPRELAGARVATLGAALWHEPEGAYPYVEMRIHAVERLDETS